MTAPRLRSLDLQGLESRLAPAAAGDLDLSFGTRGIATASFAPAGVTAVRVVGAASQSDGRILLVGTVQGATSSDFGVIRLAADGSLDTSFGTGGRVVVPFDLGGTNADTPVGVAVSPEGRIVVAGTVARGNGQTDLGVVRLLTDGSLDTTFGTNGRAVAGFDLGGTNNETATGLALTQTGAVVIAATVARATGDTDFGVLRFTSMGTLDTAWNGTGRVTVSFDLGGTKVDEAAGVVVRSDGRVVIAGTVARAAAGDTDFAVAQLTSAGSLDTSFGSGGRAVLPVDRGGANGDHATAVALAADGRVVVAGWVERQVAGDTDFAVAWLTVDGQVDKTFGLNGATTAGFDLAGNSADRALGVAVLADGRPVVAGWADAPGGSSKLAVARFTTGGAVDPEFGTKGLVSYALKSSPARDEGAAVLLRPDTRLIVAGTTGVGSLEPRFAAVRLFGTATAGPGDILASGLADGTASLFAPPTVSGTAGRRLLVETPFAGFTGVVRGATGDVTGDGVPDRVYGTGPGAAPRIRIVDGLSGAGLADFFAFEPSFTGGVFLATADLDGDGRAEVIVTPDQGGGPVVALYAGTKLAQGLSGDAAQIVRFFGIDDPTFRGGARPALGDVDGDGAADLMVAAGFLGGPRIALFGGRSLVTRAGAIVAAGGRPDASFRLVADFFAFEDTLRNGAFVAAGDVTGDGQADLIFGGGPGGGPRVRVFDGVALLAASPFGRLDEVAGTAQVADYFAGATSSRGGIRVAVKDRSGDGRGGVVTATGGGVAPRLRVYPGIDLRPPLGGPRVREDIDPFSGAVPADGVFVG